jgi:CO/xanthine dehydrogenase FAD-binding subunit
MRALEAERFAENAINWAGDHLDGATAVEFGEIAAGYSDPPDDAMGSAAYRRHAIKVMARRILEEAFGKCHEWR